MWHVAWRSAQLAASLGQTRMPPVNHHHYRSVRSATTAAIITVGHVVARPPVRRARATRQRCGCHCGCRRRRGPACVCAEAQSYFGTSVLLAPKHRLANMPTRAVARTLRNHPTPLPGVHPLLLTASTPPLPATESRATACPERPRIGTWVCTAPAGNARQARPPAGHAATRALPCIRCREGAVRPGCSKAARSPQPLVWCGVGRTAPHLVPHHAMRNL
jgi:hypothetical protein